MSLTSLNELSEANSVDNIVLFVADTLRYDYLPQEIAEMGTTVPTISPSTSTAPSFPSITSGVYPSKHNVFALDQQLANRPLLFQVSNLSMTAPTSWIDSDPLEKPPLKINHIDCSEPIEKLSQPFVYAEFDKGGHAPYGHSWSEIRNVDDFFRRYENSQKNMNNLYQKSIENTKERFLKLIDTIQERGIIDNTLIIFTSDHGELLGERKYGGIFGHGTPIAPEIIRVPTVFIGAGLPNKILSSSTLSGVDIAPTLLEAQDRRKAQYMDGIDVWNQPFPQHSRRSMNAVGIPKTLKQTYLSPSYISISFSDISGTTVYNLHNRLAGLRKFHGQLSGYVRGAPRNKYKNIFNLLSVYTSKEITYGNKPKISRNQIPDELLSDTNMYKTEHKNIQSKLDSIRCGLE